MSTESREESGSSSAPKYFLNSLDSLVRDGLVGLAVSDPRVRLLSGVDAIVRADVDELRENGSVLVVSGGGAGHEPMFAGFVGPRMLTAAISGQYFASPSAGQITRLVETITAGSRKTPVMLLLANYTGDRLNFGLAREALILKGYTDVRMVVFGDDLTPYLTSGNSKTEAEIQRKRRGLAGLAFVHRIAGSLSEEGASNEKIESVLSSLSSRIYTLSISLSAVDIPGVGASFSLPDDQMELGLGVHGESGIERLKMRSARETISLMLKKMLSFLNGNDLLKKYDSRIALAVNNLGGLTPLEMNLVVGEVVLQLTGSGVSVERLLTGHLMTSGNMKGVSLSVLLLDDQLLGLLDRSLSQEKLVNDLKILHGQVNPKDYLYKEVASEKEKSSKVNKDAKSKEDGSHSTNFNCPPELFRSLLTSACEAIIKEEARLNELDGGVGDSDCGSTLSAMGKLFLHQLAQSESPSLATLAKLVSETIGGTSGAVYGLLLTSAAGYIAAHPTTFDLLASKGSQFEDRVTGWLALVRHTIDRISVYSGAQRGDRSMLDALHGVELGLERAVETSVDEMQTLCRHLVDCTWTQAKKTAEMKAAVGRAAYVNQSYLTEADAGAVGVAIWIEALAKALLAHYQKQK